MSVGPHPVHPGGQVRVDFAPEPCTHALQNGHIGRLLRQGRPVRQVVLHLQPEGVADGPVSIGDNTGVVALILVSQAGNPIKKRMWR